MCPSSSSSSYKLSSQMGDWQSKSSTRYNQSADCQSPICEDLFLWHGVARRAKTAPSLRASVVNLLAQLKSIECRSGTS